MALCGANNSMDATDRPLTALCSARIVEYTCPLGREGYAATYIMS